MLDLSLTSVPFLSCSKSLKRCCLLCIFLSRFFIPLGNNLPFSSDKCWTVSRFITKCFFVLGLRFSELKNFLQFFSVLIYAVDVSQVIFASLVFTQIWKVKKLSSDIDARPMRTEWNTLFHGLDYVLSLESRVRVLIDLFLIHALRFLKW